MNVTFCDACGIECEHGSLPFTPLVHVVEMAEGKQSGYVDPDWNPISGRQERFDLCHECYNVVFTSAMDAFNKLKPCSGSTERPSVAGADK